MKTGLVVSIVLLIVVMAVGLWTQTAVAAQGERYEGAAQEMLALCEKDDWQRIETTVEAYRSDWDAAEGWLRMLVLHDDVDAVAIALSEILASAQTHSRVDCAVGCYRLEAAAKKLYSHDRLCTENIL